MIFIARNLVKIGEKHLMTSSENFRTFWPKVLYAVDNLSTKRIRL